MNVHTVDITSIRIDPQNVRMHDDTNLQALKRSLGRFGQQKPIVVDGNGIVIAGNGTLIAARSLGWKQIDIVTTDLQGEEAAAYAIADNHIAELATWDEEALATALESLRDNSEIDHLATGFDDEQINELILKMNKEAGFPAEVNIPEIYQVVASCSDESEQQRVYELLKAEGVVCRMSTL